jgi:hypothetical protein
MPFTAKQTAVTEVRKVAIVQKTDGSFTVSASRVFFSGAAQAYKLDLDGDSTDLDGALQAAQSFMRTGAF